MSQVTIKRVLLAVAQRSSQHSHMLIEYDCNDIITKGSNRKKTKKNNGQAKRAIAGSN